MTDLRTTPSDIYPSVYYDDATAAIDWLCRAFGFRKRLVVPGPDGQVMHSELTFGTGVIMVGTAKAEHHGMSPRAAGGVTGGMSIFVADPDAHHAAAKAAGAKIMREIQDEEYGARGYMAEDLEGHWWYFGNYRPGGFWDA
jgi:uncharacterized glyoxalase superfamily protein PhnB